VLIVIRVRGETNLTAALLRGGTNEFYELHNQNKEASVILAL